MTTTNEVHQTGPVQSALRVTVGTTLAALATNLTVFTTARAADVSFQFAQPGSAGPQTISAGAVLAATLVTMAMGWIVVGLAAWRHRPTLRTIAIVGGVIATASAVAPLALEADLSVRGALAGLHLITGAFFITGIGGLRRGGIGGIR